MSGLMAFYRVRERWWEQASASAQVGDLRAVAAAFEAEYPEILEETSALVASLTPSVDRATHARLAVARNLGELRAALDGVLFGAVLFFTSAFLVAARDRDCPLDGQPLGKLLAMLDRDLDGLRAWLAWEELGKFSAVLEGEDLGRVPLRELSALAAFAGERELAAWARQRATDGTIVLLALPTRA